MEQLKLHRKCCLHLSFSLLLLCSFSPPVLGGMDAGRGGGCECWQYGSGGWLAWRYSWGAEICLSLPSSFSLLFDLAVLSMQGCLCVPAWPGRKRMVPQHAGVGHSCSPCRSTQRMTLLTSAPPVAAGTVWSSSATCLGWDESLGSQNWSEALPGHAQALLCLAVIVQPPLPLWALKQSKSISPQLFPVCVAQHWGLHQSEA